MDVVQSLYSLMNSKQKRIPSELGGHHSLAVRPTLIHTQNPKTVTTTETTYSPYISKYAKDQYIFL